MRLQFNLSPIMPAQNYSGITSLSEAAISGYKAGDPIISPAVEAHAEAVALLAESELDLANALLAESENALALLTDSLGGTDLPPFMGFDPARFRMADNITINVSAGVIGNEDTVEDAVQRAILGIERKGAPLRYTGGL